MAENMMNMALDDDLMAQAAGGAADVDRYGYVCEGTVLQDPAVSADKTMYSVEGDNGKRYRATWRYSSPLTVGEKVQLIHEEDGSYTLEPLME